MFSASKRKFNNFEDSDEEEPSFGRQILPVANLPENFSGEPLDGMQYLFTVRRDARHLPHITRVDNPYAVEEPSGSPPQTSPTSTRHPALPSDEWRASFEKHFRNLRKNVTQPTIRVQFTPQDPNHRVMPDKKERELWWAFISGRPESDWNPPRKPKQSGHPKKKQRYARGMRAFSEDRDPETESSTPPQETWHINDEGEVELALRDDPTESLPTPSGTPVPQEPLADLSNQASPSGSKVAPGPVSYQAREPTPFLMHRIDHRMALHLLMYFTYWMNKHLQQPDVPSSHLTETHSRWIFALLSRIEDHISADDMSLLRNLARACLELLKKQMQKRSPTSATDEPSLPDWGVEASHTEQVMGERACWMIITAVVQVWGQRDLWIDAEAALANFTG